MFFAFSMVCFAAPPPVPDVVSENFQFVPPDEIQSIQTIDVQKIAFVYLGNFEMACYQCYIFEPVAKLEFLAMVMDDNYFAFAEKLKKPPSNTNLNRVINKQHSNYGYPLTAD